MFLLDAPLVARREVARGMFVLSLDAPQIANSVRAGQFVNLGWSPGPLLRRPFSVYRADGDRIEVILKAVGAGTSQLLSLAARDTISCLGPLGHGFEIPSPLRGEGQGEGRRARSVALVSGGAAGISVTWVHGARSVDELCSEADGDDVIWATDDGSRGFAGTAVSAVPETDIVLACGPNRMLAAVAMRWPDAQVAVETYMGCGTGVCLGCAVPLARGGYDRACKEGPVYRAGDVEWSMLPAHLAYAVSA